MRSQLMHDFQQKRSTYTAPSAVIKEIRESGGGDEEDPFAHTKRARIIDREDEYRKRRMDQVWSITFKLRF